MNKNFIFNVCPLIRPKSKYRVEIWYFGFFFYKPSNICWNIWLFVQLYPVQNFRFAPKNEVQLLFRLKYLVLPSLTGCGSTSTGNSDLIAKTRYKIRDTFYTVYTSLLQSRPNIPCIVLFVLIEILEPSLPF